MNYSIKRTIYGVLERDQKTALHKLDQFHEALESLRYEGKMSVGRNLTEIRQLAAYFEKEIASHMREEEKTLFPFLRTHIPRLEPMVCLLSSEHDDFRHGLKALRTSLKHCRRRGQTPNHGVIDTLYERGTYLVCLLRSHMWCETHSLYKTAETELRPEEKRRLFRQIAHGRTALKK